MKNIFEKLASPSATTSDHLKILGKRAAGLYVTKEASSLTEAVAEVVSSEDLNKDQVSRVAEAANQETWKSLFVEGGEKMTSFDPADAGVVIGRLSAKPDVTSDEFLSLMDYGSDVPNEVPSDDLAELFGIKQDSEEYAALNPVKSEEVAVEKAAAALDVARYGVDNAASILAVEADKFYKLVKQAHLNDGYGILQISKAVSYAVDDVQFGQDIMQQVAARLEGEGVKFNQKEELQKVAHPLIVNADHPLVQAAATLERAAFSYYSANDAHEKLAAVHAQADKALRSKVRGR